MPRRGRCALAGAALLLAAAWAPVGAQGTHPPACADTAGLATLDFATGERDAGRLLQLSGALSGTPALLRRGSTEAATPVCRAAAPFLSWALVVAPSGDGPTLRFLPLTLEVESNSSYRKDRNNGTLRGGVGASTAVGAGVELRWRGVSAAVAPRLVRDGNGDFETLSVSRPGFSPWVYPYEVHGYMLDFPQRFGPGPATRLDPGQSHLRLGNGRFEAGLSTENFWLGSAQIYPMLQSANAPGFPHLFFGTVSPLDVGFVRFGVHGVVGRLSESGYFDDDPENDRRLLHILAVEVTSPLLPGLHVGAARVQHETIPPAGISYQEWLRAFLNLGFTFEGGGNRPGNGLGALMARWVFPEAGFEAYAEWARDDTPYDFRDLLEEPDWTQAYTLGFTHLVALERVRLRWYGELVHLGESAPVRAGKGFASFYTHNVVTQGHTHSGQILGASPGPGSDAQIVGVDAFHGRGQSGLWLERTRYDDDTYYRRWARFYGESRHDVELGVGVRHHGEVGPVRLSAEALWTRRANRAFLGMEDRAMPRRVESNVGLRVRAAWTP